MKKGCLHEKWVLITGAGHGLGRALSVKCAENGACVIVTDRDFSRAQETYELVLRSGGRALCFEMDVTDIQSIARVRDEIIQKIGTISVLINNAGVVVGGSFEEVSLEHHLRTLDINLKGPILVTHQFVQDLMEDSNSVIVNIASASSLIPLPWASTYAASKWGVLGFTESLREEFKLKKRVRPKVIAICPSYISTGMFQGVKLPWLMTWISPESLAKKIVQSIELGKENVLTPWNVVPVPLAKAILPSAWFSALCRWLGVSRSMVEWQGHSMKN